MNASLASLGLVLLVGALLAAYLFGVSIGHSEGHDRGRREGKREGTVRAYGVGFDRGKRKREKAADSSRDDARNMPFTLLVIVVMTVVALSILGMFLK